ncbi:hypothetical protein V8C86DRAFT_3028882 [Haematococcus lacustris]
MCAKISALKQLHAGLQKAYQKALLPQDVDLLQVAVYKKTYQDLVRRVMGGDKICDPSLLDTCGAGTLLSREDMNDMMSNTLAVKTEKAATRRCLALLLWSGVARGDSVRQCKVQGISARPVKGIGPSACVKFTINYRSGKTTVVSIPMQSQCTRSKPFKAVLALPSHIANLASSTSQAAYKAAVPYLRAAQPYAPAILLTVGTASAAGLYMARRK